MLSAEPHCGRKGKQAFKTRATARRAMKIVHRKRQSPCRKCQFGRTAQVFECTDCGAWHWGHGEI